jgi:hypothetical protein
MAQPTDYISPLLQASQGQASPLQALGQGLAMGNQLEASRQQTLDNRNTNLLAAQAQQDRANTIAAAKQNAILAAQKGIQIQQDTARFIGDKPTVAGIAKLVAAHPELEASYKTQAERLSKAQEDERLSTASTVFALAQAGQTFTAIDHLNRAAMAYEKSEGPDSVEAKSLRDLAQLVDKDPTKAVEATGIYLARAMGPAEFEKTHAHLDTRESVIRKNEADAKIEEAKAETARDDALASIGVQKANMANIYSQIKYRAKQFDLDAKKLDADIAAAAAKAAADGLQLSEKQQGAYVDAIATSSAKTQMADMAKHAGDVFESQTGGVVNALATPLQQGIGAKGVEMVAGALGVTRDVDEANKEFLKIVDAEALAARPPGSGVYAKDDRAADREKALSTYASPAAKAKYMRDYETRTRTAAQIEAAKAEYLAANDGLGPAKKDITVAGKVVPKGQTFQALASALTIKPADAKPAAGSKGPPPASRVAELKAQGMSKEQAMATLKSEGYSIGGGGG